MSTAAQLGQLATLLIILLIAAILLAHVVVRVGVALWSAWDRRRESPLERYRRTQEP